MREDDEFDVDTDDDAVFARLIPRKVNKWIYPTIAAEFVSGVLRLASDAVSDLTTVFSQRWNYEDDRQKWAAEVGREIEAIEGGFDVVEFEDEFAASETDVEEC